MGHESATANDARFVLISLLPDVCLTPSKSGYPVPYVITHKMDQSEQCSPNVFLQGKPVYLHNESYVDNVRGDEPGAGKGVVSRTNVEISHSIDKSASVYVNGRPIVRTGDMMWMNWKKPAPANPTNGMPTGLGSAVDQIVAQSPTLQADLTKLQKEGWSIEYGAAGGGSWADRGTRTIVLDGNLRNTPETAAQVLAHEVGHA